jgi:hypothetical protein
LPDFVITGNDAVTIQKGNKMEPDAISILNEQFLKPDYSPEELAIADLSDPIRNQFNLNDSLNYFTGKVEAGIGIYTLPVVGLSLSNPLENGLFQITAAGKNRRAFVDNSEQYLMNGGVNVFYQLEDESMLLNGTKFKFHGDYGRISYALYAADDPYIKRDLNKGSVALRIENLLEQNLNYTLSFTDDIHSLQDNIYSENFLEFDALLRVNLSDVSFEFSSTYNVQYLKNDTVNQSTEDYFSIKPLIGYSFNDFVKAYFGLNYSNFNGQSKVHPYFHISAGIGSRFSIFAEYSPSTVFLGNGYFLGMNPYFYIQNFTNVFYEKKNAFNLSAKFEYDKFYEISGGIKYFSSATFPYFKSSDLEGRFDIVTTSVKNYTEYINLLFHLGPFGYFYGSVEFNQAKTDDEKFLPYNPNVKSYSTYGYNFDFGLNTELTLFYLSEQYIDILNNNSINPFVNLDVRFVYKLEDDFNLTFVINNLLNRKNYQWYDYQEPPLDIVFGMVYRW